MTTLQKVTVMQKMTPLQKVEELIAGLQLLATFLRNKPDFPHVWIFPLTFTVFTENRKIFSTIARQLIWRGKIEKKYSEHDCRVEKQFGEYVTLSVSISRNEVCERIVTGQKFVEGYSTAGHYEDVVEWKCK